MFGSLGRLDSNSGGNVELRLKWGKHWKQFNRSLFWKPNHLKATPGYQRLN